MLSVKVNKFKEKKKLLGCHELFLLSCERTYICYIERYRYVVFLFYVVVVSSLLLVYLV